jgi:hypothetical protein
VFLAVFCSVLASAATCFVIIRFSLVPAPEKRAAVAAVVVPPPAPVKKPTPNRTKPANLTAQTADTTDANIDPVGMVLNSAPMPPPAPPEQTDGGLAQPQAVASSALDLVTTVLQETSYVGPNNAGGHQGLYNDLTSLRKASEAVANDDGSDPATTARLNTALTKALDQAIKRTDLIANRATESDASRQISAQMNAAFQRMRGQ